jgi:hypothetical protein
MSVNMKVVRGNMKKRLFIKLVKGFRPEPGTKIKSYAKARLMRREERLLLQRGWIVKEMFWKKGDTYDVMLSHKNIRMDKVWSDCGY